MLKRKFIVAASCLVLGIVLLLQGCEKTIHGYLSDRIFYQVNPFNVVQGQTAVSASLVTDGSTTPLHVTLLAFRDATGKNVDTAFTTPQKITTFSGSISFNDSTEEALRAKLKDSMVQPFNIASTGGRLQFTSATTAVTPGSYVMDISVSNVRGTKVINNACTINLTPVESYALPGAPYGYLLDTITQARVYNVPEITVIHDASGPAVITFKWTDEDGKVFNPSAGEVRTRAGLASFENWDPFYDVVLTDTAYQFKYPDHVPLFPVFPTAKVGSATQDGYFSYYVVPAKYVLEPGQDARVGYAINFPNAIGSYNVTIRMVGVHKK